MFAVQCSSKSKERGRERSRVGGGERGGGGGEGGGGGGMVIQLVGWVGGEK